MFTRMSDLALPQLRSSLKRDIVGKAMLIPVGEANHLTPWTKLSLSCLVPNTLTMEQVRYVL